MDKINQELERLKEMEKYLTPDLNQIGTICLFGQNPKVVHATAIRFPVHRLPERPKVGKIMFEKSLSFALDEMNKSKAQELMKKFLETIFSEGKFQYQGSLYTLDKDDYSLVEFSGKLFDVKIIEDEKQ